MSFKMNNKHPEKDDKITARMTTSTISSNHSVDSQTNYDEEFTLVIKQNKPAPNLTEHCLAMKIAEKFPPKIKNQVSKMIEYYESALHNQLIDYHKLVELNTKIKKQNQYLQAQKLILQLSHTHPVPQKQNRTPLTPVQLKSPNFPKTPENNGLQERIDELQEKVIMRDRKINELNTQIGDLTLKLRKYKKRFESTGVKFD